MIRTVSDIIIYPIKSLGGINLRAAKLTERGLEHDRRWMLIDKNDRFLTIRQHPEFLFYQLELTNNGFNVTHKHQHASITIPQSLTDGKHKMAKVWDDSVEVIVADKELNDWFSATLNFECELVYLPDASARRVEPEWVKDEQNVSLADGYPYLLVGKASVDDLNTKIEEDITHQRFRPNIVIAGGEPYEEYLWKDIALGSGQLKGIKPCARCIVTTMNPATAEQGKEPLKTLYKQRINDKMIFGQNAVMTKVGVVTVGDELIINSKKQSPYQPV